MVVGGAITADKVLMGETGDAGRGKLLTRGGVEYPDERGLITKFKKGESSGVSGALNFCERMGVYAM